MILPYLGDEETLDCASLGFPGVKAVWRPMDLEDKARWNDEMKRAGIDTMSGQSTVLLVKQQLVRLEGVEVEIEKSNNGKKPKTRPFDVKKDFGRLHAAIMNAVFMELMERGEMPRELEKNSELPSGPRSPTSTDISSAAAA